MIKVDVLIYSKDRTAQLALLIKSLKKNFINLNHIFVLNDYSNERYAEAFKLILDQENVTFIKQDRDTFADTIRAVVSTNITTEFILPLCDDDFMPRYTDLDDILKCDLEDVCGINLRYHPKMCKNYLTEAYYPPPEFIDWFYPCWEWNDPRWAGTSWSYPYQAGCEVYKTKDFKRMLDNSTFMLPNTMEGAICSQALTWGKKYLASLWHQHIINISVNKVQTENGNRGGWSINYSTHDLNEMYLSGKEIDLEYCETYCQAHNDCDFIEMPLQFKDRE